MVDLQTVSILITGLGLTIGILYYALELRDSNKSRQAQLWMQLTESFRDPEFLKQYNEILYHHKWENHDDWAKKYGVEKNIEANTKITSVLSLFETVGVLVKHNLIDKKILEKQASTIFIPLWEKMEPVIKEERRLWNQPNMYDDAEYLYKELKKLDTHR